MMPMENENVIKIDALISSNDRHRQRFCFQGALHKPRHSGWTSQICRIVAIYIGTHI